MSWVTGSEADTIENSDEANVASKTRPAYITNTEVFVRHLQVRENVRGVKQQIESRTPGHIYVLLDMKMLHR
ncbi:hypothetical protein KM043_015925 [Ampulex compressa]|nr:hypothetical protein KM043_015925 [Ampulex compressa]